METEMQNKKSGKTMWILLLIILIVVGVVGYFRFNSFSNQSTAEYQAVFLSNGQVYFGHIVKANNSYIVLNNIYYFQQETGTNPTLVKLGKELHGPADIMYINKDQVLFYEDLLDTSTVVKTIKSNLQK